MPANTYSSKNSLPRLPDLKPSDCYLWRHLKTGAYFAPIENGEILHQHAPHACQTTRNHPGTFRRVQECMTERVRACVDSGG